MLRRPFRLLLAPILVLLGGVAIRLCVTVDRRRGRRPLDGLARCAQVGWCRLFCRLFGVRVATGGEPLRPGPVLVAANHVSWLDIIVLASRWPVVFLSKAEVADWPVVGGVATGLGTLYIRRGARDAAGDATAAMTQRLAAGDQIVFFPEGTTTDGSRVRSFRPRLFQAALDAGAPVQPLALRYLHGDGRRCDAVVFTDDQGLLASLVALAAVPRVTACLAPLPPLAPRGGRSALAAASEVAVAERLGVAQPGDGGVREAAG